MRACPRRRWLREMLTTTLFPGVAAISTTRNMSSIVAGAFATTLFRPVSDEGGGWGRGLWCVEARGAEMLGSSWAGGLTVADVLIGGREVAW